MIATEIKVKTYLLQLGFQPNLKGYFLLTRLIQYALEGGNILPLKYSGYPLLSKEFGVDSASVEKDIQNAISSAWLRGNVEVLYRELAKPLTKTRENPPTSSLCLLRLNE